MATAKHSITNVTTYTLSRGWFRKPTIITVTRISDEEYDIKTVSGGGPLTRQEMDFDEALAARLQAGMQSVPAAA